MCRGFLDAGKLAMQKIVEGIFSDPGVADLLKKLYQGAEWQEGRVTATFTTTLEDYFTDLNEFLDASIFRRVLELALESSVASFTAGLMSKIPPITDSVVDRMRGDEDEVCCLCNLDFVGVSVLVTINQVFVPFLVARLQYHVLF